MTTDRVVVVGGGLAGITTALALTDAGIPVTLLEARPWLGGATWSFGRRGLTIDNGQHVFPRCFSAYRELLARLGTAGSARIQDRLDLTVLTGEGQLRLRRSNWPAPLHLARVLAGYRPLTVTERLSVVPAAVAMWLADLSGPSQDGVTIGDWLGRHGQGEQARGKFWDMFLVPFLNAPTDQADAGTAAGLINAVLLSRRDQADLGVPAIPLRDLHGGPAGRLLARLGAEVRTGAQVTAIRCEPGGGYVVQVGPADAEEQQGQLPFGAGEADLIRAAGVVLAVPPWEAASIAPAAMSQDAAAWAGLVPSPVVSLHVMYDSRVTRLPFATAIGSPLRWITDRTRAAGLHAGQYLAATLPAADEYVDSPAASLREQFLPEFERLFPAAASATVHDFFVTRERGATFRPGPGSRSARPDQATRLRGFALAGAWTDTGWPDTMEGAVRSGRMAAESVLRGLAGPAASPRVGTGQPRPAALASGRAAAGSGADALDGKPAEAAGGDLAGHAAPADQPDAGPGADAPVAEVPAARSAAETAPEKAAGHPEAAVRP